MAFEHRDGSFICFKNDKDGIETRPDLTGEGKDQAGNPVRIALWVKTGKNGKFITGTIQLKDDRQVPKEKPHTAKADGFPEGSDDLSIPF